MPIHFLRRLGLLLFLFAQLFATSQLARAQAIDTTALSPDERASKEFNYTFEDPGWPWEKMAAEHLNPVALTAYRSSVYESYFLIIPEAIGIEYDLKPQQLVEVAKANLKSAAPSAEFSQERIVQVNGIDWTRFNAKMKMTNTSLAYSYAVSSQNGFNYQLITWREADQIDAADHHAESLLQKFNLVDPERIANAPDFHSIETFADAATGINADFTGLHWSNWPSSEIDVPHAHFAASKENSVFIFITPIYHKDLNPSLKNLKAVFLETVFSLDPQSQRTIDRLVRTDSGRKLVSTFDFETDAGKRFATIEIRTTKDISYLVAGFTDAEERVVDIEPAFEKVSITPIGVTEEIHDELSDEKRFFQSNALNNLGLKFHATGNYAMARRYISEAIAFVDEDPIVLTNFASISFDLEEYFPIIELYESDLEKFGEINPFKEWYAAALKSVQRNDEALQNFKEVFESGEMSESGLYSYLDLLAIAEEWEEALKVCDDFIALTSSQSARQWKASIYQQKGDIENALKELFSLKEEKPFDLAIDYDIANNYLLQEKYTQTLEYIDAIEDDISPYPYLYTLRGNAHLGLHSFVEAKKDFETAVELNPQDTDAQMLLDYATGSLGKGDTQVNKTPIETNPFPQGILKMANAAQDDTEEKTVILYSISSYKYQKEEMSRTTRKVKVAIRDDSGLDAFSTLQFEFDPFYENVYLNELYVKDKNGNVLATESRDDFYILHQESDGIVSQKKALHIPVKGLSKGVTLEYTITHDSIGLVDEVPFTREFFIFYNDTLFASASFLGDSKAIRSAASNGAVELETEDSISWYAENISAYKAEPYQADFETFVPYVIYSDAALTWESVSEEYLSQIEDKLDQDPDINDLAKKIVEGITSDKKKIEAIYAYIQKEFTYKALEFGQRALIPNKASEIVSNKYGDCKDLALLANRLLHAIEIDSYLTLIDTGNPPNDSFPSLDQFDHMILFLPSYEGGRLADCTSKYASLNLTVPIGLADRAALVLKPENPHFYNSGIQAISENSVLSQKIIDISGHDLLISETLEINGTHAAYLRHYLNDLQKQNELASMQTLLARTAGSEVQLHAFRNEKNSDPNESLKLNLEYKIPRIVDEDNNTITLKGIPNIWEKYYLNVNFVKDRTTPFSIRYPLQVDSVVTINLPDHFKVTQNSLQRPNPVSPFHKFDLVTKQSDDHKQLSLTSKVTLIPQNQSNQKFEAFQESAQNALSSIAAPIILERVQ